MAVKEKVLQKTRAHQRYKLADGTIVPGVTTILGVLAKPALIKWANNLGLQGIDSSKYVDSKAAIGTIAHYLIECHLTGQEPELTEYAPAEVSQAENGFLKWLEWEKGKQIEVLGSEMQLVSEKHGYGGTIDVYAKIDGVYTLADIKTSGSGIWPEMKHQVAAYREMLIENGYPVDRVLIVRVGRSEDEGFETAEVSNLDRHFEMFLHCQAVYRLQKELKG